MADRRQIRFFLLIPALVVLYFTFQIFRPFLLPIALAAILVSLCYPIYSWVCRLLKGRQSLAAFLTCLGVTLVIVLPVILLLIMLAGEVSQVYLKFQSNLENGKLQEYINLRRDAYWGPVVQWLDQYVDLEKVDLLGNLTASLQQLSLFFLRHSTALLSSALNLVGNFLIMIATMFFLFRDGHRLVQEIQSWSPLSARYEGLIAEKFREVARATIVGSLATALAQGVVGGLVFWVLGIPNVLFWGSLMAVFSLVPVVGTAVVWVPWVIYFLATGSVVRGLVLLALASLLVGMVDNVLRPILIEGKAGMHTLLVFFSLMGGIAYFGMVGMIFGPILVALGLTFLELFKTEFREELQKPET